MTDNKQEEKKIVFTEEDLDNCWCYYKSYLIDILNEDYDLEQARDDLKGLIGSEYDARTKKNKTYMNTDK